VPCGERLCDEAEASKMNTYEKSALSTAAPQGMACGGGVRPARKRSFRAAILKTLVITALLAYPVCGGFPQEAGQQNGQPAQEGQPPPQTQPPSDQGQQPEQQRSLLNRQQTADPDDAVVVIDVNPLMWILSGIPDKNNNRSVFFDIGVQFNMLPGISLRFNPSVSFGFTGETAFSDSRMNFVEVELPLTFMCFPFSANKYLRSVFFGVSVVNAYHNIVEGDDTGLIVSIGAMLEIGYQIKLSNRLAITPSVGVSRMFPKPMNDKPYTAPNFNLYSPWTTDTPVAPRARLTVGFWL
jgi:hypothetical protein